MKTSKGSKSAPTRKAPRPPAKGGKPEVKLDAGTTVVLPNPADAPPPPKRPAKAKKAAPSVAVRATPPADVPDWANKAAARNTATEMAAVPEAARPTESAADAPAGALRAKGRAPKAAKSAPNQAAPTEAPAAAPGSLREIGNAWIESLRAAGHSISTTSSYANDLEVAHEFFGDVKAADLTEKQIAAFNVSKGVMQKRTGKPKAQPTVLKTRRAIRLALVFAEQKGLIKKAPFPAPAKTSA